MQLRHVVLSLMLFMVGCSEQLPTAGLELPSTPGITQPNLNYAWAEDRYPTEEEYEAGCPFNTSMDLVDPPAGTFGSNLFTATAKLQFNCVNITHANLNVRVKDTLGTVLSTGLDQVTIDQFIPVSRTVPLKAYSSTLNRSCGLTGEASLHAMSELWLVRFKIFGLEPIKLHHFDADVDAYPVSQTECPPTDEGGGDNEGGGDDDCEDEADPSCWGEPECGEDGCEDGPVCRWEEWGVFAWINGQWVLLHSWWEYCGGEGGGGGDREDSIGDPPVTTSGLQGQSVQVVLVPDRDFHYGDTESVVRRDAGRSTIFLRESTANASVLTSVCRGLSALDRQAEGSSQSASGLIKLTGSGSTAPTRGSASILSELRRAPIAHHAGVGAHRTVSLNGQRLAKIGCR